MSARTLNVVGTIFLVTGLVKLHLTTGVFTPFTGNELLLAALIMCLHAEVRS
jgi:hypothetical protein